MKKIIIISYFYPPANFVGGDRIASWAKYLHESGIYPIIITRKWNLNQTELTDIIENNKLEIEYNQTHEVHRLPYKRTLRDYLSNYRILKPFQKFLTLFELIFSNIIIKALPYSNIYFHAKKVLKNNDDLKVVIVSGRPFQSFFIGHKLKKKFPYLYWIPDYRDEWTTHQNIKSLNVTASIMRQFERKSELKWTSNASMFISVSENWVLSIGGYIKKKGLVIMNGYDPLEHVIEKKNSSSLIIDFIGTLYSNQNIELILDAAILINNESIKFRFIGIEMNSGQIDRLKRYKSLDIEIHPRIDKNKLDKFIEYSDVFILSGFDGVSGWYPVKLFDYYNWNRPILLCPSDNDVIERFINETNSGFIANNKEECINILNQLIEIKKGTLNPNIQQNSVGNKYTRQTQAQKLGESLLAIY